MRFLVEAFDIETDFQAFVIELPQGCDEQIKAIMVWKEEPQGWEGYDLSQPQMQAIEELAGRSIEDRNFYFQLTCNV
ncbi:hypothetical protein [Pseudomonas sp. B707]|uniref:DUF7683 domain-containing protein n=1 Tax=Pseudomonas sp. B707 TaxID=2689570 RepID=UPI001F10FA35|nr:hypothetical protein [Pseudomonas sp. B707]MCH4897306.1 hypothetical protein [Pseudomonas sp. B707]